MTRLANKRAVLTGAASGIGAACARRFAEAGATVAILDQNAAGGAALADELRAAGFTAFFAACDVTDAAAVDAAVEAASHAIGPADILLNNAGISISGGVEELTEAQWDRQFAVNVKSIFLVARRVIPQLRARGGGSIINVASESAFAGFPMHPAYCASKAAVVQLSRSMAMRYAAERIRVNALCPGTIDTALYRGFLAQQADPDAVHAEVVRQHPLGLGTPDDIAWAAVYLASDESRYMTGTPFLIDGGMLAI